MYFSNNFFLLTNCWEKEEPPLPEQDGSFPSGLFLVMRRRYSVWSEPMAEIIPLPGKPMG